jgi:hypothetical protein
VSTFAHYGKRAALAALFSFLAAVPCAAVAQASNTLPKPNVKVDDRWIYRHTDRRMKPPSFVYEIRVSFVDPRTIHAVVERQGGKRESDATWTPEWNVVVAIDEGVVEVEKGMWQFPLSPGKQYPAAWEIRRPRAGAFHVKHERKVTVVGWEDVEVPAGKFRALKVQADGHFRRFDKLASDEARNTFWYVPQVKRWVKAVYHDAALEVTEELYFYRVQ